MALGDLVARQLEQPPNARGADAIEVGRRGRGHRGAPTEGVDDLEMAELGQRADGDRDRDHEPVAAVRSGELGDEHAGEVGRARLDLAEVHGAVLELPPA